MLKIHKLGCKFNTRLPTDSDDEDYLNYINKDQKVPPVSTF